MVRRFLSYLAGANLAVPYMHFQELALLKVQELDSTDLGISERM